MQSRERFSLLQRKKNHNCLRSGEFSAKQCTLEHPTKPSGCIIIVSSDRKRTLRNFEHQ